MKTTWTILLGIIFFATACAPNPVYRLYSEEKQNVSWNHGSEMIQLQQDSLFVTLSYYRHLDEEVIFDVEISNQSKQMIHVNPATFYINNSETPGNRSVRKAPGTEMAIDPERRLIDIDRAENRFIASERTDLTIGLGATTAIVAAAAVSDTDDHDGYYYNPNTGLYYDPYSFGPYYEDNRRSMFNFARDREVWELDVLRRTDLFPGSFIRGQVRFPLNRRGKHLNVVLPLADHNFSYLYEQVKYKSLSQID